jgi:hypothetical protein
VKKRAGPKQDGNASEEVGKGKSWLEADGARRAAGVGSVGGARGGAVAWSFKGMFEYCGLSICWLNVCVNIEFWQGAPRSIDVRNAASEKASVTLWAYSPRVCILLSFTDDSQTNII